MCPYIYTVTHQVVAFRGADSGGAQHKPAFCRRRVGQYREVLVRVNVLRPKGVPQIGKHTD